MNAKEKGNAIAALPESPVKGRIVLLPDPMGATGSSMCNAIRYYSERLDGEPAQIIAMHLIVTPEYIRQLTTTFPNTKKSAKRQEFSKRLTFFNCQSC